MKALLFIGVLLAEGASKIALPLLPCSATEEYGDSDSYDS